MVKILQMFSAHTKNAWSQHHFQGFLRYDSLYIPRFLLFLIKLMGISMCLFGVNYRKALCLMNGTKYRLLHLAQLLGIFVIMNFCRECSRLFLSKTICFSFHNLRCIDNEKLPLNPNFMLSHIFHPFPKNYFYLELFI